MVSLTIGEEFEKTRDPNVIHKFLGATYVDRKIHVTFRNEKVDHAKHNNKILEGCALQRKDLRDVKFSINDIDKFNDMLFEFKNVVVTLEFGGDGCVWSQNVKMWANNKEVGDFSIYGD